MSVIKSTAKAIYRELLTFLITVNIPQPRVLGHMFLSFLVKFIESHFGTAIYL